MYIMLNKIDKIQLDNYFNELATIYSKKSHGYEFEFVLVGGASILINYNFRDITNDIDAYFLPSADIKESIKAVSEKLHISPNWINDDFKQTKSYSDKIAQFSSYYKTYKNILTVRTIKDEYLIAMKLMSGRIYKNDISDIVGILNASRKINKNITFTMIDEAVKNLYGNWYKINIEIKDILDKILKAKDLNKLYTDTINNENQSRQQLLEFTEKYENSVNEANISDILKMLNKK